MQTPVNKWCNSLKQFFLILYKKMAVSSTESDTEESVIIEKQKPFFKNLFLAKIFILTTCIKILLIPTYHSTDFEVHRNWMAITHSLPIGNWYAADYSKWTLDYPPLFAWFEYLLSKIANLVDPDMLKVDNLNYASQATKLYQRSSVMFADLFLLYGVREIDRVFYDSDSSFIVLSLLCLCNCGLLIVDHIHFQYNGFLLGILLVSLAKVCNTSKEFQVLQGAMWFAILLNLKHLYLYIAPAYGIWILKSYCFNDQKYFLRFVKLAIITASVMCASFGPFREQIPQVVSRLFPFKRGLVHAYWAANAWALYVGADKILTVIWKKIGWINNFQNTASMTGGLVQENVFTVLPTPTPIGTFIITFFSMLPALLTLLLDEDKTNIHKKFIRCIVICGLSSFMFGWHVHEKAILTSIIPLCVLAAVDVADAKTFTILSSTGYLALMPLLFTVEMAPLKFILFVVHLVGTHLLFKQAFINYKLFVHEYFYIGLLPFVTFYEVVLHSIIFKDKMQFLPLALTSIYCSIGITYCYLVYYYHYLTNAKNKNAAKLK